MSKNIKDLLVGTLMGDAHIRKVGLDKAFISFEQSNKKSEYLNYLFNQLKDSGLNLQNEEVKKYHRTDSRYANTINKSLYFRTEASEELKEMADLFLDNSGKKIIPSNIADHLSHRSLAFWIMDDGQRVKKGGVTLCTDSYSHSEIESLRGALESKFNFVTSIHKKKGKEEGIVYERIYINKESLDQQKDLIQPHVHDSMLYKINMEVFKQNTSDMELTDTEATDNPMGLFED
jgi:hypothetical protein